MKFVCTISYLLLFGTSLFSCNRVRPYENSSEVTDSVSLTESVTVIGVPQKRILQDDNLLFVKSPENKNGQILKRIAYITSYNSSTRNPNWVAWHLISEHTNGSYQRKGVPYYDENGKAFGIPSFSPEIVRNSYFIDMQAHKPRQEHSDWGGRPSDIDHGHMCPAADCKWSKEVMNQSFLLTNMCPQNHTLNEDDWNTLEDSCRKWANKYSEIFIVAGPIFYDGVKNTFGANKIAIPDAFFKVVLCLKGSPKAIGFIFKNDSSRQPMRNQVRSVDEVEQVTGFDFFHDLPDEIENEIEKVSNLNEW